MIHFLTAEKNTFKCKNIASICNNSQRRHYCNIHKWIKSTYWIIFCTMQNTTVKNCWIIDINLLNQSLLNHANTHTYKNILVIESWIGSCNDRYSYTSLICLPSWERERERERERVRGEGEFIIKETFNYLQ